MIGGLVAVHLARLVLSPEADFKLILGFSFIPARTMGDAGAALLPGGEAARWWSLITYALLHGDAMHLTVNCLWIAAFGTPVARRFGTARFVAIAVLSAIAGAALHLAIYPHDTVPVVGASAAGSGLMGAAARFVFASEGPLDMLRRLDPLAPLRPAAPLGVVLRDRRVIAFTAIWLGLNVLFGLGGSLLPGIGGAIAWQAHIGGFLAGLLLFPFFDRGTAKRREDVMRALEEEASYHNGSS